MVTHAPLLTYQFFCPVDGHRGLGMQGTLVVHQTSVLRVLGVARACDHRQAGMHVAPVGTPVENQVGEVRQSHRLRLRQTGVGIGQSDPNPGLSRFLDDRRQVIVANNGLELLGA